MHDSHKKLRACNISTEMPEEEPAKPVEIVKPEPPQEKIKIIEFGD